MDNPRFEPPSRENQIHVTFEPGNVVCRAEANQSVQKIAAANGILLRSDCGGKGQCGQCLIAVQPAQHLTPPSEHELELLTSEQIQNGYRLACEARVRGSLTVSVPGFSLDSAGAVGKAFEGQVFQGDIGARKPSAKGGKKQAYGISIDIGTTTVAVYLCELKSGRVCASLAEANPQRRFGEDVISRILYTRENENGLVLLQRIVVDQINSMISACLMKAGAGARDVTDVTVVGNTTMQHIFTGLDPKCLGISPYVPVTYDPVNMTAAEAGLNLDPATGVHVFPVISGFVGGDTVGVMLSEKPYDRDQTSLIIDIGTNGEIVLGNKAGLWATSCATGPALEGAHIECGMRASPGAIHQVTIDPVRYRAAYEVLGGGESVRPSGICGSGIIDAVAEMRKAGLILPNGRIREGLPGVSVDEKNIGRKYVIVSAGESSGGREISISLSDIRQIQLAKSALSVGIQLLMRKAGLDRFDRLVLTGAFGARFNWKNAVTIGMLPEASYQAEVVTVANAAGRGAILALLDPESRKTIHEMAKRVRVLELAEDPDFVAAFTAATNFPEVVEK